VTDFLAEKRKEIDARLKELKPQVEEYYRLEAAADALKGLPGATATGTPASPRRRGPGRPPGSKAKAGAGKPGKAAKAKAPKAKASGKPRGRRKGSGTRGVEALAFIAAQPGITIPDLAEKMGIKKNSLYRVLPGLEQETKVRKDGRGWHPAAEAAN
jgi:hypothetical protein